jgi:hypothetical protein
MMSDDNTDPIAVDYAAIERRIREKDARFLRLYGGGPNKMKDLYMKATESDMSSLPRLVEWTRPDADKKPMVTREQYDQAKAVLDALPSGFYVKCADCGGWYTGSKTFRETPSGPVCRGGCD